MSNSRDPKDNKAQSREELAKKLQAKRREQSAYDRTVREGKMKGFDSTPQNKNAQSKDEGNPMAERTMGAVKTGFLHAAEQERLYKKNLSEHYEKTQRPESAGKAEPQTVPYMEVEATKRSSKNRTPKKSSKVKKQSVASQASSLFKPSSSGFGLGASGKSQSPLERAKAKAKQEKGKSKTPRFGGGSIKE